MKAKRFTLIALSMIMLITFSACKKEGLDGKAKIAGKVLHHETPIPKLSYISNTELKNLRDQTLLITMQVLQQMQILISSLKNFKKVITICIP